MREGERNRPIDYKKRSMRGDRHRSNERASFTMMMMEISSVSRVPSSLIRLLDIIFSFELYQQRSETQYSWCSHLAEEIAVF